MSGRLPLHVARAREPIPSLNERPWDGPDMREVMSIADMLKSLHAIDADDVDGYLALWRQHLTAVGNRVSVMYERDGRRHLMAGGPVDPQIRHRSRWMHFLFIDLRRDPRRYDRLMDIVEGEGNYADNRPNDPRETTRAMRDYLRIGCRIMLDGDLRVRAGHEVPEAFHSGSEEQAQECLRALKAFKAVRWRHRSEAHIRRAVSMLGKPQNGWIVLEARASAEQVAA
jgi:hypothetical protein